MLRILALLLEHPDGLRPTELAAETGRSLSSVYSLLRGLVDEGFAVRDRRGHYRIGGTWGKLLDPQGSSQQLLIDSSREVYNRTKQRTYAALRTPDGHLAVVAEYGRKGLPRLQGLGEVIGNEAHALALGKAILSGLSAEEVKGYAERTGLPSFTTRTITTISDLEVELACIQRQGIAYDRQEFHEGFTCLAVPIYVFGQVTGAIGLLVNARRIAEVERCGWKSALITVKGEVERLLEAEGGTQLAVRLLGRVM